MMRGPLFSLSFAVITAAAYAAAPLLTAWSIREAVRSGNHVYLAEKVDWQSVRSTLRQSLEATALGSAKDTGIASRRSSPSNWQRLKLWASHGMIHRLVDRNVTPDGLPRIYGYGKAYRAQVLGHVEPERTVANLPHRIVDFWSRVRRAEFMTPFKFEIDLTDKFNPGRYYASVLELSRQGWRLTELRGRTASNSVPLTATR